MTNARRMVLPGIQNATSQNGDSKLKFPSGFAFYSKAELRQAYELLLMENDKLKGRSEIIQLKNEITQLKDQVEKLKYCENESDSLRKKLLKLQAIEINILQGKLIPVMKIAV